ncbi:MAG: hypothetical protein Q4F65_14195, partial [Propionibacteriaceae bacterium]|nr:hypothetical protein [Propionibacteriaceae bacterium]
MYQARRAAGSPLETDAAAFVAAPRRAARSRAHVLKTRVAPTAVSIALLATSGAFALSMQATNGAQADGVQVGTPAPVREAASLSRGSERAA